MWLELTGKCDGFLLCDQSDTCWWTLATEGWSSSSPSSVRLTSERPSPGSSSISLRYEEDTQRSLLIHWEVISPSVGHTTRNTVIVLLLLLLLLYFSICVWGVILHPFCINVLYTRRIFTKMSAFFWSWCVSSVFISWVFTVCLFRPRCPQYCLPRVTWWPSWPWVSALLWWWIVATQRLWCYPYPSPWKTATLLNKTYKRVCTGHVRPPTKSCTSLSKLIKLKMVPSCS